jgi:hypothetical protein
MRRHPPCLSFLAALSVLSLLSLSLGGCAGRSPAKAPKAADPTRVEAHSAGLLSPGSAIKVVLTKASGTAGVGPAQGRLPLRAIRVGQGAHGKTSGPSPLRPIRRLSAAGIIGSRSTSASWPAPRRAARHFQLRHTRGPAARFRGDPASPRGPRRQRDGRGQPPLTDGVSDAAAEKALRASAGSLTWNHESGKLHRFTVSGIASEARAPTLELRWKGSELGGAAAARRRSSCPRRQPSSSSPPAASTRASGSKGVELAFSRPLDKGQDLRGLVSVEGAADLRYTVTGSTISLYSETWPASAKLRVEKGLKDSMGGVLALPASATVAFDYEKPLVRFITKGNILPTTQGLVLPIETMNLSGVIVEALRVYGDNMLQFLQVNDLDSSRSSSASGKSCGASASTSAGRTIGRTAGSGRDSTSGPCSPPTRKACSRSE